MFVCLFTTSNNQFVGKKESIAINFTFFNYRANGFKQFPYFSQLIYILDNKLIDMVEMEMRIAGLDLREPQFM